MQANAGKNINGKKRSKRGLTNASLRRGAGPLHKLNQVVKYCFLKRKKKTGVSLKTNPVKIPLCVQSKLLCNPFKPGNNVQAAK